MVQYANGKIYRICCGGKTLYIGSTTRMLAKRMSEHRGKGGKFEGRMDIRIVLIEVWVCQNKDELRRRE
jgi:predicted GIY-YIG superfamily endonuclease